MTKAEIILFPLHFSHLLETCWRVFFSQLKDSYASVVSLGFLDPAKQHLLDGPLVGRSNHPARAKAASAQLSSNAQKTPGRWREVSPCESHQLGFTQPKNIKNVDKPPSKTCRKAHASAYFEYPRSSGGKKPATISCFGTPWASNRSPTSHSVPFCCTKILPF